MEKNDFSKGSVVEAIIKLAVPMTLAQLINVMYSIVDRVYIGMIPGSCHAFADWNRAVPSHCFHGNGICQSVRHGRRAFMFY